MAINQQKQMEIFCAYLIDFSKLKNSVSDMIQKGSEKDLEKVERMYAYISDFVENSNTIDEIIGRMNVVQTDERLSKLVKYLNTILLENKETMYQKIQENFKELDHLIEINHITRNVNEIFDEDLVTSDPTVPISDEDLSFLNDIAKLSMENLKEMKAAEKSFKTFSFRNKIKELYAVNLFYFEQVYSNTDVRIQKKILNIIVEHHKAVDATDEEMDALRSLQDIGILTDIDALAIKSRSNISDHQAFDAFCKILRKNNNFKLMNKVMRENIIMTSMFKTNSSTIGEYYGLRKMFISARYPHNQRIIQRYMQLMEKNEAEMAMIFIILKKDMDFSKSYASYIKSTDTVEFKKFVENILIKLEEDDITEGVLESLAFVVQSFIYMDKHDTDILTQDDVFNILDKIYYYLFRNNIYKKDYSVNNVIDEYRNARLNNYLSGRVKLYHSDDITVVNGLTSGDIWYSINQYIAKYNVDHITKVHLKYNEINAYTFNVAMPLDFIGENGQNLIADELSADEALIIVADVDRKNFEIYLYGLCHRIVKALHKGTFSAQLCSVEGGMFRKKVTAGIEKEKEIALRKIVYSIRTLEFMKSINKEFFVQIYKKKIERLLDEMYNITITEAEIEEFVHFKGVNISSLTDKAAIIKLKEKYESFNYKTKDADYIEHGKSIFDLIKAR